MRLGIAWFPILFTGSRRKETTMIALSVMIETFPEFTDKYGEAVMRHARNTVVNEDGCLQFAVHRHAESPDRFFLYEAYRSEKDLTEIHEAAPYFKEFKELTASWVKAAQVDRWLAQTPSGQ